MKVENNLTHCDECHMKVDTVEIGDFDDRATVWICQDCLDKAKALFEADPVNQPVRDFSWALQQLLAGKIVRRADSTIILEIKTVAQINGIFSSYHSQHNYFNFVWVATRENLEATDWEIFDSPDESS